MIKIAENLFPIINIASIVLILFTLYSGYKKGALWQVIRILCIVAVIVLAWIISPGMSGLVNIFPVKWMPFSDSALSSVFYSKFNQLAWFIILLVIGLVIVFLLIKPLLEVITDLPFLKSINGVIGAVFSLIPVYIVMVLISYILSTAIFSNGKDAIDRTVLKYVKSSSNAVVSFLSDSFQNNLALQKLFNDPLSLDREDLKSVIDWLKKAKVSSEDIAAFFEKYGIDVEKINDLLN